MKGSIVERDNVAPKKFGESKGKTVAQRIGKEEVVQEKKKEGKAIKAFSSDEISKKREYGHLTDENFMLVENMTQDDINLALEEIKSMLSPESIEYLMKIGKVNDDSFIDEEASDELVHIPPSTVEFDQDYEGELFDLHGRKVISRTSTTVAHFKDDLFSTLEPGNGLSIHQQIIQYFEETDLFIVLNNQKNDDSHFYRLEEIFEARSSYSNIISQ
jgi:hypothetical protein